MEIALRLLTQGTFPKQACGCLGEELLGCNTQKGNSGTGSNWWRADTRRATPLKALAWACGRPRSSRGTWTARCGATLMLRLRFRLAYISFSL